MPRKVEPADWDLDSETPNESTQLGYEMYFLDQLELAGFYTLELNEFLYHCAVVARARRANDPELFHWPFVDRRFRESLARQWAPLPQLQSFPDERWFLTRVQLRVMDEIKWRARFRNKSIVWAGIRIDSNGTTTLIVSPDSAAAESCAADGGEAGEANTKGR